MCYLYTLESAHAQGPSEFAVVGVHDNTDVTITLPPEVDDVTIGSDRGSGGTITLQRCETFQVGFMILKHVSTYLIESMIYTHTK